MTFHTPEEAVKLETILAPTDFSEMSRASAREALELARASGARLVLLHVLADAPPPLLPDVAGFHYADLVDNLQRRAEEELPEFLSGERTEGVEIDYQVAVGSPHQEIVRVADEIGADLIVLATHGRTGALHLLLGSVAERVVRHAGCDVLIVKSGRRRRE